ncbi:MAG: GyrI-like domain-containing protein [Saprospiraceae bacterium]|nr:GyrI-like domain-containing protein [Saprospiraceae bacterium]
MKTIVADIKKTFLPSRTFAYIRHQGPYMGDTQLFERIFNQVATWVTRNGLFKADSEAITIYHDDPETVSPDDQRISVGFTVPEGTEGDAEIKTTIIPSGDFVIGSFEIEEKEYADAWQSLFEYLNSNGFKPSGHIMYESYKNDPTKHPEGKHMVDICISV